MELGTWNFSATAALVYDTPSEFLASGDFNSDGLPDVLVLDKLTGNARVGYQNVSGALDWSPPLPTGADPVTALAVGRFAQTNRDAIAVTAAGLNSIRIVTLSESSNAPAPAVLNPAHPDVALLVGLDAPYGTTSDRSWLVAGAHDPSLTLLDLFAFAADGLASFQDQVAAEGYLRGASSFRRVAGDATLLAAIRRVGSNDTFLAFAYTNTAAPVLVRSNLPPGVEYVFGTFNNEPSPRLLFYVPGGSNIIVQPLIKTGADFAFGLAVSNTFAAAVERVFYVDEQTNGLVVVHFGDGVVGGLRLSGSDGQLHLTYGFGAGAAGNAVTGVAPLGIGKFVLLSGASNLLSSSSAQVFTRDAGGNYIQTASNALSSVTSAATRGNVWLFAADPFAQGPATMIESLSAPVWSSAVDFVPGLAVRVETDGGATAGLGNPATNNLGSPPAGTSYALPNQYRDDVSFFGYAPARAAQPSLVNISPPPGPYTGPIQISFATLDAGDDVFYRAGPASSWQLFTGAFGLTNDATIEYYGSTPAGAKSRSQFATYTLASSVVPLEPAVTLPGGETNPPPIFDTNRVILSAGGTVFYSRHSAVAGSSDSIWAINLDGSGETFITDGARPRVSRDGKRMAFLRGGSVISLGDIWVRDLSSGQETRFFTNSDSILAFDWAGTNLVFDNNCVLLSGPEGGPFTPLPPALTPECYNGAPVVNPADGRLAFQNINPAGPQGVYVTPPDWSSRTKIAEPTTLRLRWPAWSPDGSRLLMADQTTSAYVNTGVNLWTVNADGSNLRQVTALAEPDGFPHGAIWTPDGCGIVGAGTIDGTNGLWVIPLESDGGPCHCAPRLLPTAAGSDVDFAGSVAVAPGPSLVGPRPGLFIRAEPGAIVVYWSTNYDGYALQSAAALPAGLAWTPVNGPYFLAGPYFEYREPRAALQTEQFFRLSNPGVLVLTPTEPELSFQAVGNQIVLTWPQSYAGYLLETATNLTPPVLWQPLAGAYPLTNGVFELRTNLISPRSPQQYFRLRSP